MGLRSVMKQRGAAIADGHFIENRWKLARLLRLPQPFNE